MAVDKKFFVDINLQGNALNNATVGSNSDMSKAGSFRFDGSRLEYYDGSSTQSVANLGDIAAVTGGLILQGGYDAAANNPDIADGTAKKGYFWVVTTAGTFLGESVQVGDSIIAKVNNAVAGIADWLILQGNVVIATDSIDGIVRLATQAEADAGTEGGAVVITPATLQGKIDAQITPSINDKLSKTGGTMSGSIDMGAYELNNASLVQTNRVDTDYLSSKSDPGNAPILSYDNLDFDNAKTIINLPAPTNGGDAANKTYVDGAASTAQANAEATAAADATTKANAAQAAAEAYADSLAPNYDPAGAAATAESNANTYTDTQIDAQTYGKKIDLVDWTGSAGNYSYTFASPLGTSFLTMSSLDSGTGEYVEVSYSISGSNVTVYVNNLPTDTLYVSLVKANWVA